jgi:hypothetical protein
MYFKNSLYDSATPYEPDEEKIRLYGERARKKYSSDIENFFFILPNIVVDFAYSFNKCASLLFEVDGSHVGMNVVFSVPDSILNFAVDEYTFGTIIKE